ncbi:MAG: LEA type 2 family protein [Magnetococcales bacterium]|nr:LEA type 2 family protein [Magnetococcales bacterium]
MIWLCLLSGTGLLLSGCSVLPEWAENRPKLEKPRLSLVDVQLVKREKNSKWEPRFRVRLKVENPNPVEFPIGGIECRVELQGMAFATGKSSEFFTIPAHGDAEFDVEVATELLKAMKQLSSLLRKGVASVDYRIVGIIHVEIPFLGAVPFDKSGTLKKSIQWDE